MCQNYAAPPSIMADGLFATVLREVFLTSPEPANADSLTLEGMELSNENKQRKTRQQLIVTHKFVFSSAEYQ
jgi:hypothetical protein